MPNRSHDARRAARGRAQSSLRSLAAALFAFVVLLSFTSRTYAADLSGTWTASSLRVSWSIGDWGKACGPRPSGGGERGGTVTLTKSGAGFKLSGLNRSYSTTQCWERMPGLAPKSHSAGSSAIKTTCRMPAGDPRQATVITSWYPRGDEIYFDETGQYQFVVSGSNCTASVRRTRVLKRVIEKQEPEPVSESEETKSEEPKAVDPKTTEKKAPSTAPPPPPKRASRCDKPGAAVHLEVTPKTKLMRTGEEFSFQAVARDKNGCRAKIQTEWKLLSGNGGKLKKDGTLVVPKDAQTGSLSIQAQVGDQSVKVTARIVSDEEYNSLIAGGEYGVMGESLDAASIRLSTSHVEFDTETVPEKKENNTTLLLVVAALFLILGGLAIVLVKRHNKSAAAHAESLQEVPDEAPVAAPAAPVDDSAKSEAAPPKTVRLCPVCGKRYDDGTMFCGDDGARLVRSN